MGFLILGLCCAILATPAFAESSNTPTKKARDRADKVMSTLLPGPPEVSYTMNNSSPKTAESDDCPCRSSSRLEKGITGVMGGVWQLATFWYPENSSAGPVCAACGRKIDKDVR